MPQDSDSDLAIAFRPVDAAPVDPLGSFEIGHQTDNVCGEQPAHQKPRRRARRGAPTHPQPPDRDCAAQGRSDKYGVEVSLEEPQGRKMGDIEHEQGGGRDRKHRLGQDPAIPYRRLNRHQHGQHDARSRTQKADRTEAECQRAEGQRRHHHVAEPPQVPEDRHHQKCRQRLETRRQNPAACARSVTR